MKASEIAKEAMNLRNLESNPGEFIKHAEQMPPEVLVRYVCTMNSNYNPVIQSRLNTDVIQTLINEKINENHKNQFAGRKFHHSANA